MFSADQAVFKIFGLILIVVGIVIFKCLKSECSVFLNSASGESQALKSDDKSYINKVINALNESIVHRG